MVDLARTIYNPRHGDTPASRSRPPGELCDQHRFPTQTAIERHLFDAFIPAAYRRHPNPDKTSRWSAADAERYLIYLARHLDQNLYGSTDLTWWQLPAALPRARLRVLTGVAAASAVMLTCGLAGAFLVGLC